MGHSRHSDVNWPVAPPIRLAPRSLCDNLGTVSELKGDKKRELITKMF